MGSCSHKKHQQIPLLSVISRVRGIQLHKLGAYQISSTLMASSLNVSGYWQLGMYL